MDERRRRQQWIALLAGLLFIALSIGIILLTPNEPRGPTYVTIVHVEGME
jgi:hypothetical protein